MRAMPTTGSSTSLARSQSAACPTLWGRPHARHDGSSQGSGASIRTFTYDGTGRLTKSACTVGHHSYGYNGLRHDVRQSADVSCAGMIQDDTESLGGNVRVPGQYFDKETNLHYNYFRDDDHRLDWREPRAL